MSSDALAHLCESLDGPMAIVTAFDGRERSGCLVGFHTQCSIAPSRWIVCISKKNHTYGIAPSGWRCTSYAATSSGSRNSSAPLPMTLCRSSNSSVVNGAPPVAVRRFLQAATTFSGACSNASTQATTSHT